MDISAVAHASDNFLLQLGLEQAGDRLSLKAFCARECETSDKSGEGKEFKEKKRTLLESFLRKKSKKPKQQVIFHRRRQLKSRAKLSWDGNTLRVMHKDLFLSHWLKEEGPEQSLCLQHRTG